MNIKAMLRECLPIYRVYIKSVEAYNRFRYQKAKKEGKELELLSGLYQRHLGKPLRNPPVSYTEKIQFSKLYDSTPLKGMLSDKYAVREWVAEKIGEEYLIPLIGAWDCFDDIPWDELPDKFVLKTNHGSATNIIVEDKSKANKKEIKKKIDLWLSLDFAFSGKGFELHYSYIKPKVIAEQYIVDSNGELNDYKFLCFNGKPHFCWVDVDRQIGHKRNVYDLEWNLQPWIQAYPRSDREIPKPENFEDLKNIAQKLCEEFAHVRVDLYDVDGKIYFGEMTFTNAQGFNPITPSEYDDMLGELWK